MIFSYPGITNQNYHSRTIIQENKKITNVYTQTESGISAIQVVPLCSSSMAMMYDCINHIVQLLNLFASFVVLFGQL